MADSVTAPEELITPSNTVPKKTKPAKGTSPRQLPPSPFNLPPAVPVFEERDGLRKVKPYMFEFQSYAKERWQNRTLLDVCVAEALVEPSSAADLQVFLRALHLQLQ